MRDAHAGAGLVHDVNGLVRQESVGDIAIRKLDGEINRLIRILHAMMLFVTLPQAEQNLDRVFH